MSELGKDDDASPVLRPVAVAFFFGSMTLLEGKGLGEVQNRLEAVSQTGIRLLSCAMAKHIPLTIRHMSRRCYVIGEAYSQLDLHNSTQPSS
jgi:hypothetical protein